jgi:hypothetical protein
MNSESVTDITALDARISAVERSVSSHSDPGIITKLLTLKKQRNALTPLCAAPDEIIAHILAELTSEPAEPTSFFEMERNRPNPKWSVVVLVCSRIRIVALQTPKLWFFVNGWSHPSWIKLCMERASTHSLTVFSLSDKSEETIQLTTSLLCAASVVDLTFSTDTERAQRQLEAFAAAITRLKSLKVRWIPTPLNTTAFLHGAWDDLVELSVTKLILSPPPLFARLRHLRLDQTRCPDNKFSIVFDFLRSSPLLEVLETVQAGFWNEHDSYLHWAVVLRKGPTISMPYLQIVSIEEDPSTASLLLEALPDPARVLATSNHHWEPLHIPLEEHPDPARVSLGRPTQENVFDYLNGFWQAKSGLKSLPPGRLVIVGSGSNTMSIQYGTQPSTATQAPSIYYACRCEIGGPDPILDTVDTIYLRLEVDWDGEEWTDSPEFDEHLARRLRSTDQGKLNIKHILVGDMEESPASRSLEAWLRNRQTSNTTSMNSRTPTLCYEGWESSEAKEWAARLVEEGLVQSVVWSPKLSARQ